MPIKSASIADRRCVVLGAAGFIGTNLCRGLLDEGATVIGVDVKSSNPALPGLERHTIQLAETALLEQLLRPDDVVFHLVSTTVPGSPVTPEQDVAENVLPTLRLMESCVRRKIGRVVFVSSGGTVYGPDVPVPTPEDAPTNPISSYGTQKLMIEKYLSIYRRLHGLDSFVLRISNPFGPHQINPRQGLIASVIRHALAGTPVNVFGDGLAIRDYIYIDDAVSAMVRAAVIDNAMVPRTYNIGTGVRRSINDVISTVEAAHGRPIAVNRLPRRSVDLLVSQLDISRAAEFLQWRPAMPWEQAIQLSYAWAKAN